MNDLVEDYSLLVSAVRDAGALAMQYFGTQPTVWQKKGGTPVSEADIAVDTLFRRQLAETRPDYGWLSEETEDDSYPTDAPASLGGRSYRRNAGIPQSLTTLLPRGGIGRVRKADHGCSVQSGA